MKKIISIIIICAIVLGLAGCESAPPEKRGLRIGVCTYKQSDTFISTILSNMERISKEYEQRTGVKVNLEIVDAKESQRAQNEQIKRFISLKYDVICINMVDRTNAAPLIDDAIAAGIPLIFFNREPVESDIMRGENIYYVGSDAKMTAVLQGEIIVFSYRRYPKLIDKNGNGKLEYCMLEGEMGHQDAIIRTEWSVRTIGDYGIQAEKLQGGVANWDRNQAAAFVEQWSDKMTNGEIEVIICNNDDMALGAADALEKLGISDIAIVGIDATPQGLDGVRNGKLVGTVDCNPKAHAQGIFELAYGIALEGKVPDGIALENERYVRVPLRKVTRANVDKLD